MQEIDLTSWKRATHYQVFRNSAQPQYCVSFELDITNFLTKIRERGYSFTFAFVYAVSKPVIYEKINTSFTYLEQETELFKVVNVEMQDTMEAYVTLAERIEKNQSVYFTGPMADDIFQFSPFPWVSFTHISHTDSGNRDQATPLFDWGKFYERSGKILLPFSVQVHHSFVDGIHIGKLSQHLQKYLDEFA